MSNIELDMLKVIVPSKHFGFQWKHMVDHSVLPECHQELSCRELDKTTHELCENVVFLILCRV